MLFDLDTGGELLMNPEKSQYLSTFSQLCSKAKVKPEGESEADFEDNDQSSDVYLVDDFEFLDSQRHLWDVSLDPAKFIQSHVLRFEMQRGSTQGRTQMGFKITDVDLCLDGNRHCEAKQKL